MSSAARFIYADNAATTRLLPQVLDKMIPYLTEEYGNPSSLYSFGQAARQGVDAARITMAECLHCRPTRCSSLREAARRTTGR